MDKISVVYKDSSIVKVEEELSDLYIRELKKHYNDVIKTEWQFGDGISSREIVIRDRNTDAVVADGVVKETLSETDICRAVVELYSLPRENNERQKFIQKVKLYFRDRDDVLEINGEEKPQRYTLEISVKCKKDVAKRLLKFYIKAIRYHYPNATIRNYYPIVTKEDTRLSLENRFDDNRWVGEIWLFIKQNKRNIVKISQYTWYKRQRKLVLSLNCLPKSKQREFVKKVKRMFKDEKAKIQVC
jgi:hypothetical protein